MKEQHHEAYLNIIQNLLNCRSEDEFQEIFAVNQELLDIGFLQTIEREANMYSQQGYENTANWLLNLAIQLGATLNLDNKVHLQSLSEEEAKEYSHFLTKALQITSESGGDPQVVCPLLAKNTDKLNEVLAEILRQWAINRLGEAEADEVKNLATVIFNFSSLIYQFPLGDKASNIEIAITGYEVVLKVRTREAFPQSWARIQNNLGLAYGYRIKGDQADNLEKAIAACTAALTVLTREAFPQDWATTQNNLGIAYQDRIKGDKADNLEKAIAAYTAALTVRTREALPQDWATTQNNLGIAYQDRIKGDKADNLERAISAYTAALTVFTREAFPQYWATTQNNLATAYKDDRIKGDKADNLERAISAYTAALTVFTREAFPQDWAATQNNLGLIYRYKIKGDKADNLEKAISACTKALTVFSREALPQNWAATQNNLGIAYQDRIKGDKADNLEKAIAAYTAALTVFTREALPQDWAATQNNLGLVYCYRIKGDKADNLEKAISACTKALTVFSREALPQNWAATQNNLGIAYQDRIKGDKADNLEKAIGACTKALNVMTREAFPIGYVKTLWVLGITYQNTNQFDLAYNTFKSAIITIESLREEIVSGEEIKRKQAEEWHQLYCRMVEVCLKSDMIEEAIEYVELSKTRNLVEQILIRDQKTIFPVDVLTQLEKYGDEIATGQYQFQNGKAENPKVLAEHLQQLRQQRNELQNRYLPVGSGFQFNSFQTNLDEHTAIIEWYILEHKILAFIIKPKEEVSAWQSQAEDREALENLLDRYLQKYYEQKDKWQESLGEELKKLASILHIDEILTKIPNHCTQIILIPHRSLHLCPLHALPVSQNSENSLSLLDLFAGNVSYAPSCQILQQVQKRDRSDFESMFAIQNPTEDLYQDYEKDLGAVSAIKKQFTERYILKKANAKKNAILHHDEKTRLFTLNKKLAQANNIFFFCHGEFNPNSSLDSGLQLADESLYLVDIITHFNLEKCRLVTLAACETGMIDFNNQSDEYIGFPYGFLLAGATNVVSSLWTVSATATALLMIKFYEELKQQININVALNQTQRWLRDTTAEEFQIWLKKSSLSMAWRRELDRYFAKLIPTTRPFESPFYWSAFFVTGKGV